MYFSLYLKEIDERSIGKDALENLENRNLFLQFSYSSDFANRNESNPSSIFGKWISLCSSEKVRWYLKDLNTYLITKKLGEMELNEAKEIEQYVNENLDIANKIASVVQSFHNNMDKKLDQIRDIFAKQNLHEVSSLKEISFELWGEKFNKKESRFTYQGSQLIKNIIKLTNFDIYCQIGHNGLDKFTWHYWVSRGKKDLDSYKLHIVPETRIHFNSSITAEELAEYHKDQIVKIIEVLGRN